MAKPAVEFYQDEQGGHRFRVKGGNGEIVAGSEPYASESNARRGVADLREILNAIHADTNTRTIGAKQPAGE
jgi:uncharacterized protein YegP (UPF0339 family)